MRRVFRGSDGDDPARFAALYELHHRGLLSYFMRRTFDAEVAVDLAAETFAQVLARPDRLRRLDDDEQAAYLYGTGRHLLARYFRQGRVEQAAMRRLGVPRPQLDDESLARIEELADVEPLRGIVAEQLRALSSEYREVLRLRIVQELPYPAVARRLGISEQNARARVSRALRLLDKRLSGALLDEGAP